MVAYYPHPSPFEIMSFEVTPCKIKILQIIRLYVIIFYLVYTRLYVVFTTVSEYLITEIYSKLDR